MFEEYEYKIINSHENNRTQIKRLFFEIQELATEGWRLIQIIRPSEDFYEWIAILERPKRMNPTRR